MVKYRIGIIPFDGSVTPICHCIGGDRALGAGFAASVPNKHKDYIRELQAYPVGNFYVSRDTNGLTIAHLVTKNYSHEKPTLESFELAIRMLAFHAKIAGITTFYCPMMGSGLDGLRWTAVEEILDHSDLEFVVYVLPDHPQAQIVQNLYHP